MTNVGDCAGQTVVVTGGASGIGRATARLLLERGAHVLAIDSNAQACEALRREAGNEALSVLVADLGNSSGVESVREFLECRTVQPNALVNVAGQVAVKSFLECNWGDWVSLLQTNVLSMVEMARLVLPGMVARGGGAIVNMASLSAHLATPLESMYCVSKAAVVQLTRSIAVEFRGAGIRCNCVSPGMVDTKHGHSEMTALKRSGVNLSLEDVNAGQMRLANPEEIARAIVFLATSEASFVNGAELIIDNALSAGAGSMA